MVDHMTRVNLDFAWGALQERAERGSASAGEVRHVFVSRVSFTLPAPSNVFLAFTSRAPRSGGLAVSATHGLQSSAVPWKVTRSVGLRRGPPPPQTWDTTLVSTYTTTVVKLGGARLVERKSADVKETKHGLIWARVR